jgi:long-chain-fatty-acid--CoA ligase ACSBG
LFYELIQLFLYFKIHYLIFFLFISGFAAGMYTTNLPDACFHCLETSKANIAVVEDDKQLEKILSVKSRLPHLKAIIQYEGKPTVEGVLSVSF